MDQWLGGPAWKIDTDAEVKMMAQKTKKREMRSLQFFLIFVSPSLALEVQHSGDGRLGRPSRGSFGTAGIDSVIGSVHSRLR